MIKYSDSGMLLISRAISEFIPPFYSTSKNFYGIILDVFRFRSLFMAYRYSLVSQENTDSMYSMFEVHSILNTDISLSQVKVIQYCRKTRVKLEEQEYSLKNYRVFLKSAICENALGIYQMVLGFNDLR